MATEAQRILVAGMGNELLQDDGFGVVVARRYAVTGPPDGVHVYEAGIAGIGLVQEMMEGYDSVVIVDAIDRGGIPGTVYVLEADVPDLAKVSPDDRRDFLADAHYTAPGKALILSQALGVLPGCVYIVGCQPAEQGLGLELTAPVAAAVDEAVDRLHEVTTSLLEGSRYVPGRPA